MGERRHRRLLRQPAVSRRQLDQSLPLRSWHGDNMRGDPRRRRGRLAHRVEAPHLFDHVTGVWLGSTLAALFHTRHLALVLPLLLPVVLGGVTATYGAFGEEVGGLRPLGFLALYDLVFLALAWGTSEHLLGD